eukprot:CAMPEP_0117419984 /NCGR_PEP_ID=MMETSP0758-20121206/1434_1 /TAXON_ID=63605 /ORGANISM="Percolomonas cosmopolitus, Strain AE-1 (ATCC 50343)" /LENGTH=420 /DNA_ID=CAMNT_0005201371 /DNA_START=162 /DNA_END=1421 /DNA_ORIENTATION=+
MTDIGEPTEWIIQTNINGGEANGEFTNDNLSFAFNQSFVEYDEEYGADFENIAEEGYDFTRKTRELTWKNIENIDIEKLHKSDQKEIEKLLEVQPHLVSLDPSLINTKEKIDHAFRCLQYLVEIRDADGQLETEKREAISNQVMLHLQEEEQKNKLRDKYLNDVKDENISLQERLTQQANVITQAEMKDHENKTLREKQEQLESQMEDIKDLNELYTEVQKLNFEMNEELDRQVQIDMQMLFDTSKQIDETFSLIIDLKPSQHDFQPFHVIKDNTFLDTHETDTIMDIKQLKLHGDYMVLQDRPFYWMLHMSGLSSPGQQYIRLKVEALPEVETARSSLMHSHLSDDDKAEEEEEEDLATDDTDASQDANVFYLPSKQGSVVCFPLRGNPACVQGVFESPLPTGNFRFSIEICNKYALQW